MSQSNKRLLTGLQPSGTLHIGNYFGALKPFVDLHNDYESFLMIADYHALTSVKDQDGLHENILSVARDYLSAGVNPEKVTIFQQSQISEHTELAWIFECLVTVPFLMQAHAYKDKVAKGLEANAGLFNYPMLMAADILLYDVDVVPVGSDQRQHVEYAREAANKFNLTYGETFTEPQEHILESVGTVPGTDGLKMSKSYKNTIPLFGTRDEIAGAVMSIVTDSEGDVPQNVYAIHKLFRSESELASVYKEHAGKYKALKEILIEDIESLVAPMRKRRENEFTEEVVHTIINEGSAKAKEIASEKMKQIREIIGIALG